VSYVAEVENELKMLFRLSPSIWYYGQMFGILLNSDSKYGGGTIGQYASNLGQRTFDVALS
jgi:hypothetical protein